MKLRDQLVQHRLVPVISIDSPDVAPSLADALVTGGLPMAEIAFRTDAAAESLRRMREAGPDILLGAGTVLDVATAERAVDAGAEFIVAPGFSRSVIEYCLEHGIPVVPGVSTPTDIQQAVEAGLTLVKFFPAEASGGLDFLKAVAAPYRQIEFMPTGGISLENLNDYLAFDPVVACGGSWIASQSLLDERQFDQIRDNAAAAVTAIADSVREEPTSYSSVK